MLYDFDGLRYGGIFTVPLSWKNVTFIIGHSSIKAEARHRLSIFQHHNSNIPLHIYTLKYAESVPRFNPLSSSFSCFAKIDLPLVSLFLLLQILLLLSIFSSSSCYSPRPSLLLLLLSLPSFTWNRSRSSVLRSRRLPILPVHLPGKGNNQHGQWGSFILIYIQQRNKTQPCILLQLQNFYAW